MKTAIFLAMSLILALTGALACAEDRVVYHIDETPAQASKALRNIGNHLDVDPGVQIIAVAHAGGVDFLMGGAKDRDGNLYAGQVAALAARGVSFEVCEVTMKARGLNKELFLQNVNFTPSGVVRRAKLQQQGYAYIKP
jgi:intracellular sulfur oxidation DsrE/DsrF family protein